MRASNLIREVYREHINHFGEPDKSIRYGDGTCIPGKEHFPSLIDIFIWLPDAEIDITTFATIGMAEKAMENADYRAELHFAVRGDLTEKAISEVSIFLANMAVYPFMNNSCLDWYHIISNPGKIPCFETATSILLLPAFVKDGWDTIQAVGHQVKILNIVPITDVEKEIVKQKGINDFFAYLDKENIDMFSKR